MAEGISIGATQKWPVVAGGVGQRRWTADVWAIALDRSISRAEAVCRLRLSVRGARHICSIW